MTAIYKKELKTYFYSFVGFLFVAVNICLLGLHASVYNLHYASPYMRDVLSGIVLLFFITIPILTMRVLAEEKKQKTDQLILTAPVTVREIVVGKFLALSTIFAIPTAVVCLFPLILSKFGEVPMGENYLAILGFFLYGETCIAIGVFISSLTESQVIAAVISFAVLFTGYLMPSICNLISATGNWITRFLRCFDLYTPFYNLTQGTLNLESVAYFLSVIVLMLFLTVQSIQKRRYTVSAKKFSIGAYSTGMVVIAVVVTVVFNLAIGLLPEHMKAIDVTGNRMYTLTDETKDFVKNLEEDIDIYVYVNKNRQDFRLGITLDQYDELSDRIKVTYVDPAINPKFAEQYTTNQISENSLIVVSEKRSKVIDASKIYATAYDKKTGQGFISGYDGEGQITSALAYVTLEDTKKLYFLKGHDEAGVSENFKKALLKQNIRYSTIELMREETLPEDAACLYINAPVKDLSKEDTEKIITYLQKGGNVVVVLALSNNEMPNLDSLLDYMAVKTVPGIIVETDKSNYNGIQTGLFPTVGISTYTGTFTPRDYIFAPLSRGLVVNKENKESQNIMYTALLKTSEDAFSRVDSTNVEETYEKGENDISGPFAVALEAKKFHDGTEETMVVVSSEFLFTDETDDVVHGANQKLFTNIVGEFTDYHVNSSVPVKSYEVSTLVMTEMEKRIIMVAVSIVAPVILLAAGFVVWFRRRKR